MDVRKDDKTLEHKRELKEASKRKKCENWCEMKEIWRKKDFHQSPLMLIILFLSHSVSLAFIHKMTFLPRIPLSKCFFNWKDVILRSSGYEFMYVCVYRTQVPLKVYNTFLIRISMYVWYEEMSIKAFFFSHTSTKLKKRRSKKQF